MLWEGRGRAAGWWLVLHKTSHFSTGWKITTLPCRTRQLCGCLALPHKEGSLKGYLEAAFILFMLLYFMLLSLLCAWPGCMRVISAGRSYVIYLPLYSSSPLKYFHPPPLPPSSPRSAASPTGVTDLILFSHRALTSLSGASLPLSSVLLFSSPLASAKLLDGEKTM